MVEGGGVFGEDGRKSVLLQMTSLIIGHNGKKDAYGNEKKFDKTNLILFIMKKYQKEKKEVICYEKIFQLESIC